MKENLIKTWSERAYQEAIEAGHTLGDWEQIEQNLLVVVCSKCGGEITVNGPDKSLSVRKDHFMSQEQCPGDDPELMAAIEERMGKALARVYALLLSTAKERKGK